MLKSKWLIAAAALAIGITGAQAQNTYKIGMAATA